MLNWRFQLRVGRPGATWMGGEEENTGVPSRAHAEAGPGFPALLPGRSLPRPPGCFDGGHAKWVWVIWKVDFITTEGKERVQGSGSEWARRAGRGGAVGGIQGRRGRFAGCSGWGEAEWAGGGKEKRALWRGWRKCARSPVLLRRLLGGTARWARDAAELEVGAATAAATTAATAAAPGASRCLLPGRPSCTRANRGRRGAGLFHWAAGAPGEPRLPVFHHRRQPSHGPAVPHLPGVSVGLLIPVPMYPLLASWYPCPPWQPLATSPVFCLFCHMEILSPSLPPSLSISVSLTPSVQLIPPDFIHSVSAN